MGLLNNDTLLMKCLQLSVLCFFVVKIVSKGEKVSFCVNRGNLPSIQVMAIFSAFLNLEGYVENTNKVISVI